MSQQELRDSTVNDIADPKTLTSAEYDSTWYTEAGRAAGRIHICR
jgi:hypothetical protein